MSKRVGLPRKSASERTIRRWLNPMERTALMQRGTKLELEDATNSSSTHGRNYGRLGQRAKRVSVR